jgi:hypothetical protein
MKVRCELAIGVEGVKEECSRPLTVKKGGVDLGVMKGKEGECSSYLISFFCAFF